MRKTTKSPGEKIIKDIKRATRKHYSSEEKIRIVLEGLRGVDCIVANAIIANSRYSFRQRPPDYKLLQQSLEQCHIHHHRKAK